jgi:hypothetical protein
MEESNMDSNKRNLIHNESCFSRNTLKERMERYGIRNLARMELFLWDLEIFLQIQDILGDRVVLKGGAAVQFYLPVDYQRTSIDIDMIFCGSKEEIVDVLNKIETKLGTDKGYFVFREHVPENPKTKLPLYTFFTKVPSVCNQNELYNSQDFSQNIKVEFITYECDMDINKATGKGLFAVESEKEFNLLPINNLFADKLTTIGSNTIGIPDSRMDEQIKQFFDIHALMMFNMDTFDFDVIKHKYFERAKIETISRNIDFNEKEIITDVLYQLSQLGVIDSGDNTYYKRYIDDFQSNYISKRISRPHSEWAIMGEQLKFLIELIFVKNKGIDLLKLAFKIDQILLFNHLSGVEKGTAIRSFKELFIKEYGSMSSINYKVLKGKSLNRLFWSVAVPDNIERIDHFIKDRLNL